MPPGTVPSEPPTAADLLKTERTRVGTIESCLDEQSVYPPPYTVTQSFCLQNLRRAPGARAFAPGVPVCVAFRKGQNLSDEMPDSSVLQEMASA